jgi:hypothetical protein
MDSVDKAIRWAGAYFNKQKPEIVLLFLVVCFCGYMASVALPRVEAMYRHTEEQHTEQIDRLCRTFDAVEKRREALIEKLIDKRTTEYAE